METEIPKCATSAFKKCSTVRGERTMIWHTWTPSEGDGWKRNQVMTTLLIFQFLWSLVGAGCRLAFNNQQFVYDSQVFKRASCTICFFHFWDRKETLVNITLRVKDVQTWEMVDDATNQTHYADPDDVDGAVYNSFRWEYNRKQWTECCRQAQDCCGSMSTHESPDHEAWENRSTLACSPVWTLEHCWPALAVAETLRVDCPNYYYSYYPKPPCKRYYERTCLGNNTWESEDRCASQEFHRRPPEGSSPEVVLINGTTTGNETRQQCCMTARGFQLTREAYRLDTCALCYKYISTKAKSGRFMYSSILGALLDLDDGFKVTWAEQENPLLLMSLRDDIVRRKWHQCCEKAMECCDGMTTAGQYVGDGEFCPRNWDGWQCLEDTPAGQSARGTCPDYIYFGHKIIPVCRGQPEKKCESNGKWFRKMKDGVLTEHTDYTGCGAHEVQRSLEVFLISCFAVSLVALIPALIIFSIYRQLRVARVRMHRNFFLALLLSCISSIVFRCVVILPELDMERQEPTPMETNLAGCKVLLTVTRYFRMCTYTWMLCEGFYLQKLIISAFAEQKRLLGFYLVGWVFPILPVTVYATVMKTQCDRDCWVTPTPYEWILQAFYLSCIIINVVFLINIIRVLITKLRSIQSNEPQHYRKAVRATLVLIPLFGTHFILAAYNDPRSTNSCTVMTFYGYFKYAIDGLQGFCVALIFCYLNGEVLYLLKRSYERYKVHRGLQPNCTRSRWSMSTQMSNALDHHSVHQQQQKATSPLSNGRPTEKNGSATPLREPRTPLSEGRSPTSESRGFGFDNVVLSKQKVTEL